MLDLIVNNWQKISVILGAYGALILLFYKVKKIMSLLYQKDTGEPRYIPRKDLEKMFIDEIGKCRIMQEKNFSELATKQCFNNLSKEVAVFSRGVTTLLDVCDKRFASIDNRLEKITDELIQQNRKSGASYNG